MELSDEIINGFNRVIGYSNSSEDRKYPGEKLRQDREEMIKKMISNGYTEEEINIVVGVTPQELAETVKDIIYTAQRRGIEKVDKPSFYHVAGQPGCGKSGAIKVIENSLDKKPFSSEMDVYRTRHPRITEIKKIIGEKFPGDKDKQGKEFIALTSLFADEVELSVISYMLEQGYSVIKETTGKNSKAMTGMIEALKYYYPNISASVACMAVSQEVSIDGTLDRGATMNQLTDIFTSDLKQSGIDIQPIGRGNVPREFSELVCSAIPSSMSNIVKSGIIDGEFIIVKRGFEDNIVSRLSGVECKDNAENIEMILEDRITGKTAQEDARKHFDKEEEDNRKAEEALINGDLEPTIDLYIYPTMTWLKETDGAMDFYSKESGLTDINSIARWLITNKLIPDLNKQKSNDGELMEMFEEESKEQIETIKEETSELDDMFDNSSEKDLVNVGENNQNVM